MPVDVTRGPLRIAEGGHAPPGDMVRRDDATMSSRDNKRREMLMTMPIDTTRRRTMQIAAGLAAVPIIQAAASGIAVAAPPNVVGVWRLVAATAVDDSGKKLGVPYGPRGMGIVTLTSDGRMMAVLCDGRASLPAGSKREYASYCGNYTFDGSTLTTTVDANSDPSRFTAPQVRKVRFEGERMILVPPVVEVNGARVTRELAWERISTVSL